MAAAPPTIRSDPTPADQGSRSTRLLGLVRKLIDYGKELAATVRQRVVSDPAFVARCFGTCDIAQLLARISRGLHRANELEARVVRRAASLDAAPKAHKARSAGNKPPAPRADEPDTQVACLPTPAQIAAEVRRRPIGAVIADICRDLGIMPSHPLWPELQLAMIEYDGNLARLLKDTVNQAFQSLLARPPTSDPGLREPAAWHGSALRYQAPSSTGPP